MEQVSFKANIPVIFLQENGQVVAYTPALDLSACGKTVKDAQKSFREAARLFLEECHRMGTLGEVLAGFGWKRAKHGWTPPSVIRESPPSVDIPVPV